MYHLAVLKYQSFVLTHLCGMPLFQVNSDSPILKTCYCPVTIASRLIRQHHPRCASVYMKLQTLKSIQRASYSIYFVTFSNFFKGLVNRIKKTIAVCIAGPGNREMTACTVIPSVLWHFLIKDPVRPCGCTSIFAFKN